MESNVYTAPTANPNSTEKVCQECGAAINRKAEICPKCGVRQKGQVNKVVLLLLAFFGGGFGMHKFYLRKPVQGVLYLLFFWTSIPGLIALVELIVYACTTEERLNEKYEASSAGVVVLICVIAVFMMIMMLGIVAAVALPAYQDYTLRAKVGQMLQATEPLQSSVQQQVARTGELPASAAEIEAAPLSVPGIGVAELANDGVIVIRFDASFPPAGSENTLELVPSIDGAQLSWSCTGGSLPPRYRPQRCR